MTGSYFFVLKLPEDDNLVQKYGDVLIIVMNVILLRASARGYSVCKTIHGMNNTKYMSVHWLGYGLEVRISNPDRSKQFFSSPKRPDRFWIPLNLLFYRYRGSFQGIKRSGPEVSHLSPVSAEVKNARSCTTGLRMWPHGVDKADFIFL